MACSPAKTIPLGIKINPGEIGGQYLKLFIEYVD